MPLFEAGDLGESLCKLQLRGVGARGFGVRALGLGDAVPVDPSVLATAAGDVQKALRDQAIKLPKPKRAGMKIDRAAFEAHSDLAEKARLYAAALRILAARRRRRTS